MICSSSSRPGNKCAQEKEFTAAAWAQRLVRTAGLRAEAELLHYLQLIQQAVAPRVVLGVVGQPLLDRILLPINDTGAAAHASTSAPPQGLAHAVVVPQGPVVVRST